jgi:hypothetical protein
MSVTTLRSEGEKVTVSGETLIRSSKKRVPNGSAPARCSAVMPDASHGNEIFPASTTGRRMIAVEHEA